MATECECSYGLLLYQALDPRGLVITSSSAGMQSYISLQKIMSQNLILAMICMCFTMEQLERLTGAHGHIPHAHELTTVIGT
jgi:hypothetical protein